MARLLTALSLFSLMSIPAWAEDFRDAKFGMSPQEVRATEEDADWESSVEDALAFEKWPPKIGQCYKVESGLRRRIPEHGQTT